MWAHLGLCALAGVFLLDLAQTEGIYSRDRDRIRMLGNGNLGSCT